MFTVDFEEKQRHVFGTVNQRMPNPLVYPFRSDALETPAMALLQFRASRLDVSFAQIRDQKELCKQLQSTMADDVNAADHFYPAVERLLTLCLEKIKRANFLNKEYLGNPQFEEYLPQIVQMLKDSSQTIHNQLRYANEALTLARDTRLSKQTIEFLPILKARIEQIENSDARGYEFANGFVPKSANQPTESDTPKD